MENWKWGIDSSEKIQQKIAKKLKNWEEFVAKKQIEQDKQELMNCPCIKRGILRLSTVDSNSRFTEQSTLSDAREFCDPETASRSTLNYSASQNLAMPRFWIAARYTNDYLLEKDELLLSSTIQRISHPLLKNGDLTFQEIQSDPRVKWDENRRIRQHLYHASKVEVDCKIILVELILTVVWLIDYPRLPISELHLGKFPDLVEVQSWRVNFKTEVCSKSADPHLTVHWITEVEIAKSIEELLTSRSILGRNDFTDYDMLDATIASALKRLLNTQIHFRKRVSVEEQRAQKYDRFQRGRQIAYMIYEHFRSTGAHDAAEGLSDLFTQSLQNDDVQDSDVPWDQAQESASDMPSDAILEGLYKSKITEFCSTPDCICIVWSRNGSKQWKAELLHILMTVVKNHLFRWWDMETSGFRAMLWNEDQSPRVKKERKRSLRGKWESVFSWRHMDNVQKKTHVVSVMTD